MPWVWRVNSSERFVFRVCFETKESRGVSRVEYRDTVPFRCWKKSRGDASLGTAYLHFRRFVDNLNNTRYVIAYNTNIENRIKLFIVNYFDIIYTLFVYMCIQLLH